MVQFDRISGVLGIVRGCGSV